MKALRRMVLVLCILVAANRSDGNDVPIVENVVAAQRTDESGLVDITFGLFDADGDVARIEIYMSQDGGVSFPFQCRLQCWVSLRL